jgi:ribose transport system substrate-binding protein
MRHRLLLTVLAALVAAVAAAAALSGTAADVAGAKAQLNRFRAVPKFVPPGPAFDARKAVRGKSLFVIPASSQVPFVATIDRHMKTIARKVGLRYTSWQNQGQPSQWVQGMNTAVAQGADAIVLLAGNDPASLQPQIRAAKAKGIPTIVAHLYDVNQKPAPNVGGLVNIPYETAGRLIADYAIVDTNGNTNAIVITINQVKSTIPMVRGIRSEFAKYCDGCKLKFTDVTIPELATKIQPNVQAALTADPGINYVIALYDSAESPFAEAAIRAAGKTGRVKISTFNGTPEILKKVKDGDIIAMDVGENLDWIAHAIMDQSMRIIGGLKPVKNPRVPLRVFDDSNIAQTGPRFLGGFGKGYPTGYERLWKLRK